MKIKHTPFEGEPTEFKSLRLACDELGLNHKTVQMQFYRLRKTRKPQEYIFTGGKLERI